MANHLLYHSKLHPMAWLYLPQKGQDPKAWTNFDIHCLGPKLGMDMAWNFGTVANRIGDLGQDKPGME